MSIQAVGASTSVYNAPKMNKVNFGENQAAEKNQTTTVPQAEPEKKKGGWGPAIASFFITGLGQMCDGRAKDGFKQLGAVMGLGALSGISYTLGIAAKNKVGQIAAIAAGVVAGFGALGTAIYSVVDAYKGGKKD